MVLRRLQSDGSFDDKIVTPPRPDMGSPTSFEIFGFSDVFDGVDDFPSLPALPCLLDLDLFHTYLISSLARSLFFCFFKFSLRF